MNAPGVDAPTVALIGGGHSHVQVLRRWAMDPPKDVRLLVVLDQPVAVYSGMVPGFVAGDYALHELEIDVVPLARRAGAGVILTRALDLDPVRSEIALEGRPPIRFDFASIDIGSTVRGLDLPGVREHALATRPIGDFVRALDERLKTLKQQAKNPRIAIVGGGAAGCEIALTLGARLRAADQVREITVVTSQAQLLTGTSDAFRSRLDRELSSAGIQTQPNARVIAVDPKGVELDGGDRIDADLVIWATGAAPTSFGSPRDPATAPTSPLRRDDRGYLAVRDTLQCIGFDHVFAVGDCARIDVHPWIPRAGVYAVRQGPVLDQNLRRVLRGQAPRVYRPQRDFLSLLHAGGGRALGGKWGLAAAGSAVLRVKDWIDRRFMERFQMLDPAGNLLAANAKLGAMDDDDAEEMACGGCAAKLGALPLSAALAQLPKPSPDETVLLGLDARDDVAATRSAAGDILLHNIDVIRAFCDDPYLVGQVAANNALSDLHAKGGRPTHAQAIIGLPEAPAEIAREMLYQTLAGLRATLDACGVTLLGGHTTIGDALTVGLSVTGEGPEESELLRQAGTRAGDVLLLTQPLGVGVVLAADMQGHLPGEALQSAHAWMRTTNAAAGRIAREQNVHAATDITGFGIAGHALTLLEAGHLCARLDPSAVPFLPQAERLWRAGKRSTAHPQNREAFIHRIGGAAEFDEAWLFDPQTAGGLLLSVDPKRVARIQSAFREAGEPEPVAIGIIEVPGPEAPPPERIPGGARGRIEIIEFGERPRPIH